MKMKNLFKLVLICGLASFALAACGLTGKYTQSAFEGEAIYFDDNKYDLRADAKSILDFKIAYMKHHPGDRVLIIGYCDSRSNDEYNLVLGRLRAEEAKRYMVDEGGINSNRIEIMSEGKRMPTTPNTSRESLAENRKAEFFVTAKSNSL